MTTAPYCSSADRANSRAADHRPQPALDTAAAAAPPRAVATRPARRRATAPREQRPRRSRRDSGLHCARTTVPPWSSDEMTHDPEPESEAAVAGACCCCRPDGSVRRGARADVRLEADAGVRHARRARGRSRRRSATDSPSSRGELDGVGQRDSRRSAAADRGRRRSGRSPGRESTSIAIAWPRRGSQRIDAPSTMRLHHAWAGSRAAACRATMRETSSRSSMSRDCAQPARSIA